MNIKNRGTGAGGAITNFNGIKFEEKIYLYNWLKQIPNIFLEECASKTKRTQLFKIYNQKNQLMAYYGRQVRMYDALKDFLGKSFSNDYIAEILSTRIHPDAFIMNCQTNTVHIFEKKWQQSSGSVDEKIQTAPYKVAMFEKLLRQFGIKVTYTYILSQYYQNKKYNNVRDYYKNLFSNIYVYIEGLNLEDLKVEDYLK